MFPLQPDISQTETGEAGLAADQSGQQGEAEGGEVSEGEDRLVGILGAGSVMYILTRKI